MAAVTVDSTTGGGPGDEAVEAVEDEASGDGGGAGRRNRVPTLGAAVGAGFVLWGLLIGIQPLHDNSFLTHLTTGRLMVASGHIPRSDPYSFTAPGQAWVVQSWLASLVYGLADRVGGLGAVRLFNAALVASLAGLVWHLTAPARSLIGRVLVAGLALAVGTGLWVERPYLLGLVCLALVLAVVQGRADLRWLIPVMWVWVNAHGSFPLAFLAMALGARLDHERPTRLLHAAGWMAVGTALGALGPLGEKVLTFPFQLVGSTEKFGVIEEWRPPKFDSPWQVLFLVQLAVAVALLVRHRRWRTAVSLLLFTVLALTSARNIVLASLVMVPGMAVGAAGLGSIDGDRRTPAARLGIVGAGLAGVLLVVSALGQPHANLAAYPEDAVTWMAGQGLLDDHVVAPDYVGNYLEARYRGTVPVFVDDRVDMYPADVVADEVTLLRAKPGWPGVLERHDAGVVLWPRAKPLAKAMQRSDRWRVVWEDDQWLVFRPV